MIARTMLLLAAMLALPAAAAPAGGLADSERRSGYHFLLPETRALQDDDFANPGMLWVAEGEKLWNTAAGLERTSCFGCHGVPRSLAGAAARHPRWDEQYGRPATLELRINTCRTRYQRAPALPPESREMLALTALVARQSRGMPLDVDVSGPMRRWLDNGRDRWTRRVGQLNLSCANCHDAAWGRRLAGETISQGHPNGFPVYRLEWQALGSFARRIDACMSGVRAQPYERNDDALVELEIYMKWRARGLPVEAPAVRR